MKPTLLFGRSQVTLGAIGEQAADGAAVALSRGGAAKPYAHTDPNEDAALAARGRRGALVAVADGHWGARAAEIAIEVLRDRYLADWLDGSDRTTDRWYQEALHALAAINDAILAEHSEDARSRTTLCFALARPREDLLVAASIGDSHLFTAGARDVREILPKPRKISVLGHEPVTPSQLERLARFDVRPLGEIEALVAVTDGLSEEGIGVEDPLAAVRDAVAVARAVPLAERAHVVVHAVVAAALAAHARHDAGDNVSAAAVGWAR
jgi:hypothetical protein